MKHADGMSSDDEMSSLDQSTLGNVRQDVENQARTGIKILGFKGRKHHPIPADMYVIAGKYIDVPPELIGLLKNASETINIHVFTLLAISDWQTVNMNGLRNREHHAFHLES